MNPTLRSLLPLVVLGSLACSHLRPASPEGGPWRQYATPSEAGFSAEGLEQAFRQAEEAGSASVMAVYRGRVLLAWGDVERELELHSVRKSLYSAMYGAALNRGLVDLDSDLAGLGLDDLQGLSESERAATVEDLITARSGVYHPSAYSPADMDQGLPARGSHQAGAFFYYNNWDFNAAAAILEQAAGADLYQSFERWIAEPLGMEDWDPGDSYRAYEPLTSRFPAHTFRMSTRDLARLGQLYLDQGRWAGEQVVPQDWVERSTRPVSTFEDGCGYGYMWWVYPAGCLSAERYPMTSRHAVIQARGTGGQALFLVPEADLVLVHRGDTDRGRGVSGQAIWGILESVLAARQGEPAERPRSLPLAPRAFAGAQPYEPPALAPVAAEEAADLMGRYEFAAGVLGQVFPFAGRAYIQVPREGEAELFALAPDLYAIKVEPGVRIRVERDAEGRITALVAEVGGQEMRARKVE